MSVVQKRDRLTRLKQARDSLRMDNVKLRHQGGLVGHLDLLRDFEEQVDKASVLGCLHHYALLHAPTPAPRVCHIKLYHTVLLW